MAENCFGAKNAQNQLFTSISKPQFSCELTWFTKVDLIVQETANKNFGANYAQNQLVTSISKTHFCSEPVWFTK